MRGLWLRCLPHTLPRLEMSAQGISEGSVEVVEEVELLNTPEKDVCLLSFLVLLTVVSIV